MTREPRFRRRALLALLLALLVSAFRPTPAAALAPFSALTLASFDLHTDFNVFLFAAAPSRSATVAYSLNVSPMDSLRRGFSVFSTTGSGPVITNADVSPINPPAQGGVVTVTATVTATAGVSSVLAKVYQDGATGNSYFINLTNGGSGSTYTGTYTLPANTDQKDHSYQAVITATDQSSNTGQANAAHASVQQHDSQAPVITNATAPATVAAQGGPVTVSATVTDTGGNNLGVYQVIAKVYQDGATGNSYFINLTNGGSGSTYTGTYTLPANTDQKDHSYQAVITATDQSNNQSQASAITTQQHDSQAPVITNATAPATVAAQGGPVTVSATVTDTGGNNLGVYQVIAKVYQDGATGNSYFINLTNGGSGSTYTGTYTLPANTDQKDHSYQAVITATDQSNNQSQASAITTQQHDSQAPVITNATAPATVAAQGGPVTVSATVTDTGGNNLGVYQVIAKVYQDGATGNSYFINLTNGGSGSTYTGTYTLPANTDQKDHSYQAVITATDQSSNTGQANAAHASVQQHDSQAPVITNATAPATVAAQGGPVTVSATVTDTGGNNLGVYQVIAKVYQDGATGNSYFINLTNGGSGSTYTGTYTLPANTDQKDHSYQAVITATDQSNNQSQASAITTQQHDSQAPVITNVTQTPSLVPESGGQVTVSATVTDTGGNNLGVYQVIAKVYQDGATGNSYFINLTNGGSGSTYTGTYTIGASGDTVTHTFAAVVSATDQSNNTSSGNTGNLVYQSDGARNPVPQLTSLSPNQVAQGTTTDTAIYVIGSSFVPQSAVLVNGSPVATTYDGNTQLHFTLPASGAVNAVTYMVQVNNPALFGTDGGTSASLPLAVVPVTLISLTFPSPVPGGTVLTATVTLNEATPVDVVVGLSSTDSSIVRLQRAVTVPAGSSSATFAINTFRSHVTKTVTIQATLGQVALTKDLTITGR